MLSSSFGFALRKTKHKPWGNTKSRLFLAVQKHLGHNLISLYMRFYLTCKYIRGIVFLCRIVRRLSEVVGTRVGLDKQFFRISKQNTILNNIFQAKTWLLSFADHKQWQNIFFTAFCTHKSGISFFACL